MPMSEGSVFAGYTVLRLLGSGGMGEVYLADHPRLPRKDALKVLPAHVSADAEYRERFLREADLAASLWHPNIVRVNDRGEFDGQLWIAMDYVDGTDAGQLLSQRYPAGMPLDLAVNIITAVADALDYSHRQGLLHRDVKPANIMVTDPTDDHDRRILLADFGIARSAEDISGLTATNMTVGTVAYTAPEQLMGEPVDGRADQYSLAATAYQLLTGTQLFPHSNPAVVISRHLNTDPPAVSQHRPELAGLDAVAKALSKAPDDRYPRCKDFAQAVAGQASTSAPVSKASTVQASIQKKDAERRSAGSPRVPAAAQSGRRRWLIPAAVGVVVILLAAAAIWAVFKPSGPNNPTATSAPSASASASTTAGLPSAATTPSSPTPVTTFAAPAPNPNRPPQGNCPPACTQIPDAAWIDPAAIPLYNDYRWAPLAALSEPVTNPRFKIDELCAAPPASSDERDGSLAARIILPNPPGQWQLQVQVLHWRGDPWIAGQRASAVMDGAVNILRNNCAFSSPGVYVTRIAEQNLPGGNPGQSLAATITETGTTPMVAHVYLISDLRNSTVVELAMWSATPLTVDWSPINDDQLFADMVAPLCTAYVNSCTS
ncbi:hypothetical protein A5724_04935 [Mycobacterium sp. ACS1612]|uniref:serine/threonine-protein kinase n=1 Tax=Mycobacterium sp. ACS1612 TaxID=1834117 RepID=UPI0007FEF87A|nr:serine/threonine-protein kinase [Mycobacterium sp. ACS1612]OBF41680.1 hypothetical protein A5724_04935 [Mycobacterium sp. ACS1612]